MTLQNFQGDSGHYNDFVSNENYDSCTFNVQSIDSRVVVKYFAILYFL